MYQIYDIKLQCYVGKPYGSLHAAHRRADKLDMAYGAVRYQVRRVG
jgi:hypothetical protein